MRLVIPHTTEQERPVDKARLSYNINGAVEATGFTRSRIYESIRDGSLKTFTAGRRRMISAKELAAFVAKLERDSQGRAA